MDTDRSPVEIATLEARSNTLWRAFLAATAESPLRFDPAQCVVCRRVWEGSDYVAQSCLQAPSLLRELHDGGHLYRAYGQGELQHQSEAYLATVRDEAALGIELRRFRRREMVRIIWRDLAGWAALAETLEDLSELADVCIRQARTRLMDWLTRDLGTPRDDAGQPQSLVILGMGKLGARELNLSSDVDLIFAYPAGGWTDGPRRLSNEQFFIRLSQRLIQILGAQTADGFVFRVDTRLRPFGEAGPLAVSFAFLEDYYQSQAREWERYAMIKARVVAGSPQDAETLEALLKPFVYRRYLDYGAIESLRDLKDRIERELKLQGMAQNIKLGAGGIREIEFIGQVFQLIRGGREPDLRIRPILPVLEQLSHKGLLPGVAAKALQAAYIFLRRVENRLQAWQDRQSHTLPQEPLGQLRLARSMDYPDWQGFFRDLETHRILVQRCFDDVFSTHEARLDPARQPWTALWQGEMDRETAKTLWVTLGVFDSTAILDLLEAFRRSRTCRNLTPSGRGRLDRLMPTLMALLTETREPAATWERLLGLLEAIGQRTSYLALLVENPQVLPHLTRLMRESVWIADQLARHPLLLDELMDPQRLYEPPRSAERQRELEILLSGLDPDDLEQQMDRLRVFRQSQQLRVAAADISGILSVREVSDHLSEIAGILCQQSLDLAFTHLVRRHGTPAAEEGCGFLIIGYGKLGGRELGYGSDLDLVFLHGSGCSGWMTQGSHPISGEVFFARLGQRLIHLFTAHTPAGVLYAVDSRLRPHGAAGLLVNSLEAFASYQAQEAWTWEHQALLRAQPIAGDPELASAFARIRRDVLSRNRPAGPLRQAVVEMREKMRGSLDKSQGDRFDLKQGHGGMTDIEFMVQYLVLGAAHRHPDLLEQTSNIRLLEALAGVGLLAEETARDLVEAYQVLRARYHRESLQNHRGPVAFDSLDPAVIHVVRRQWQLLLGE
ncbi:Glutamine synthetase adenylyl-L-tyrosine phosphorylase / Glutamine synthetase adenylyl transferase [Gammaproteobacteria bacterium]